MDHKLSISRFSTRTKCGQGGGVAKSHEQSQMSLTEATLANILSSHCVLHECTNEANRHGDAEVKVEVLIYSNNFVLLSSTMRIFGIIIAFLSPAAVFAP